MRTEGGYRQAAAKRLQKMQKGMKYPAEAVKGYEKPPTEENDDPVLNDEIEEELED